MLSSHLLSDTGPTVCFAGAVSDVVVNVVGCKIAVTMCVCIYIYLVFDMRIVHSWPLICRQWHLL
jgi:ABC-type transport system involved in Fe-S cluster assembly fused permease/ATPase subunit